METDERGRPAAKHGRCEKHGVTLIALADEALECPWCDKEEEQEREWEIEQEAEREWEIEEEERELEIEREEQDEKG